MGALLRYIYHELITKTRVINVACLCPHRRFWNDHTSNRGWKSVPHCLWPFWLCRDHPLLQPLPGAHHLPAGIHHEGVLREAAAKEWSPTSQLPKGAGRVRGGQPRGLEAVRLSCDADPGNFCYRPFLLRLGHVHGSGRMELH